MHHGKYRYEDFLNESIASNYRFELVGPASKRRQVLVPNKKLKAFLTFLNLFVFEYLPIQKDVVFSYRKGATAAQAVERHRDAKYFLQMDIQDFFPSIGRALIEDSISAGADSTPVADLKSHIARILDFTCVDDQLPLGFPTSSPLSNAVLFRFDGRLLDYCQALGLQYTRYSDDLIFSSHNPIPRACADEIQEILTQQTLGLLSINRSKTKFFQTGGKIKILGMMILPNKKITIDSKIKIDLEVLLHFYLTDRKKFTDKADGDEQRGIEKTAGYLSYANSIDADYVNRLRRKFGASTVDMFLHRSYPQ